MFFQHKNIITLENPIEYLFESPSQLVTQREYGSDFRTWERGLEDALRMDPDIILVGELRDISTIRTTITAAETGHLVLGTLHASSVIEAIIRMESFFNQEQIEAISMQIASSLNSIIIQKLIPTIDENLVCCMDILLASTAVKNLISKNQLSQLISQMQLNRQNGMQFIRDDIEKLVKAKLIDEKIAKKYIG